MPNQQNQWLYKKPSAPTGDFGYLIPFIFGPMAIVYGGIVSAGISGGFSALTFMATRNTMLAKKAFSRGMITLPALALGAYIADGYETRNMRIARLQSNIDYSVAKQNYPLLKFSAQNLIEMGATPNLDTKTRQTIQATCNSLQEELDELCVSDYGIDEAEDAARDCKRFLALYDSLIANNTVTSTPTASEKPKPRI